MTIKCASLFVLYDTVSKGKSWISVQLKTLYVEMLLSTLYGRVRWKHPLSLKI